MTYEDAIRVADLKTRRAPLRAHPPRERGAATGSVVVVTDYLKPDLDEIYGILPAGDRRGPSRAGPSGAGPTAARRSAST